MHSLRKRTSFGLSLTQSAHFVNTLIGKFRTILVNNRHHKTKTLDKGDGGGYNDNRIFRKGL